MGPYLRANPLHGHKMDTRADMLAALGRFMAPLASCRSSGGARLYLSPAGACFDQAASEMEGFARPLWGLVPAALGGDDPVDWALYREGLANGTDPAHPEYWGAVGDLDQRMVELAAIGFALLAVPDRIWGPQPDAAKQRIAAYLRAATQRRFSSNNWMFFRLLIDAGLRRVGEAIAVDSGAVDRAALDGLSLGNGWYRDGPGRRVDHYTGFAFHTYGLLLARFAPETDAGEHLARARLFAPQFASWFDAQGRGLAFGRSMTYRFAACAFFGAYALAEGEPVVSWGALKGLVLRHLRAWGEMPIADRDGVLSVGYGYPNPLMAEDYNSPTSPYWALKAFLPLALDAAHPFWTAEEEPLPALVPVQPAPGFLLSRFGAQTVALASGQECDVFRHGAEKYAKFAYSTAYPFSIEPREARLDTAALDSMLGVQAAGRAWGGRTGCETAEIIEINGAQAVRSIWDPYPDVRVETILMPCGEGHIRWHKITTDVALETVEGGFAIPRTGQAARHTAAGGAALAADADESVIIDMAGLSQMPRRARVHAPAANTNLAAPRSWVPQLIGHLPVGVHNLACYCAAAPSLTPDPDLTNVQATLETLAASLAAACGGGLEGIRIGAMTGAPDI